MHASIDAGQIWASSHS